MKQHEFVLILFLSAAALIALLFYYFYSTSTEAPLEGETGVAHPGKKRFIFLLLWGFSLLVLLSITIPKSPYFLFADKTPSQVVYVAARQYNFIMSYKAIDSKKPAGESIIEIPSGEPVEFRVTSIDVTHGFAIYNQRAELVTQTQAMPGYVNRLRWEFPEPGEYNILCLEYCGQAHPFMRGSFIVK